MKRQILNYSKYDIYDDGRIWSHRKGRFLKPGISFIYNPYAKVLLLGDNGAYKTWGVHQLVLMAFVGSPPSGMECHHKDHNKLNNHISNLEYVTHSENILRSYSETDRESYWKGKEREKHSLETIRKMAMAKEKPVIARRGDKEVEFRSIEAVVGHFGTYRGKVYRCMKHGRDLGGWNISFK